MLALVTAWRRADPSTNLQAFLEVVRELAACLDVPGLRRNGVADHYPIIATSGGGVTPKRVDQDHGPGLSSRSPTLQRPLRAWGIDLPRLLRPGLRLVSGGHRFALRLALARGLLLRFSPFRRACRSAADWQTGPPQATSLGIG